MVKILGLDIGGANTKYALIEKKTDSVELLTVGSSYFPIWKNYLDFSNFLNKLKENIQKEFGEISQVVFVTTAELADCFQTKKEGITKICNDVSQVFISDSKNNLPHILDVNGNFIPSSEASEKWLSVSASNWFASAEYLALKFPNAIVLDIGSTTTDIVPIFDHKVVAQGSNDLERLISNELVYTGLLRTNVATIVHKIKLRSKTIPLASEIFATTGDVYYLLDEISKEEFSVETADGKPVTKMNSSARLARIICADLNQLSNKEIIEIAQQIKNKQVIMISQAYEYVRQNYLKKYNFDPEIILIGLGSKTLAINILRNLDIKNVILIDDILNEEALNCFSAFAVAQLFIYKKINEK
jgi:probable H4MPT-linked C1 transfer pathway protein